MNYFDNVKAVLFQYKGLGEMTSSTGVVLIGRAPHIAPEAWLHSLFPPLVCDEVEALEREVHHDIPTVYKDFLLYYSNGISVFNNAIYLYGLRKIVGRTIEAVRQPFSLDIPNTIERPKNAKEEYLFIGGYSWDGSKIYIDGLTNKVYYCARWDATPLCEWNSFPEMLLSEIDRIRKHFDSDGKRIDKSIPTTPVPIKL